jgi:tRNA(fMet)-specific endonuclease VapC
LTYLLDTNTCVEYLNGRSRRVVEALRRRVPEEIAICSVVRAELHYGAWRREATTGGAGQGRRIPGAVPLITF